MSKEVEISDTKPDEPYYYEFVAGTSSKFWEITVNGNSYTTRFGKIGTDGKASTKEWASQEDSIKQATKQRNLKIKKGYVFK